MLPDLVLTHVSEDIVMEVAEQLHEHWKPRKMAELKSEDKPLERWKSARFSDEIEKFDSLSQWYPHQLRRNPATREWEIDILNLPFKLLSTVWQVENIRSARSVIDLVLAHPEENLEELAHRVHEAWLDRNRETAEPDQLVAYSQLTEFEQELDREPVRAAIVALTKHGHLPSTELSQ